MTGATRPGRRAALAALVLAPLAAKTALAQDGATRAELATALRDGRIATDALSTGGVRTRAMIDATFGRTIARLLAFDAYPSWLEPVSRLAVLTRSRGRARVYAEVTLVSGLASRWAELDVHVDGHADGLHTLTARAVAGELGRLDLRVAVIATPGRVRSLVGVTSHLELGLPFMGDASRGAAEGLVHALRASFSRDAGAVAPTRDASTSCPRSG